MKAQCCRGSAAMLGAVIAAFVVGYIVRGCVMPRATREAAQTVQTAQVSEWTCSMHPQIRQGKQGRCPACGMDLIPVDKGGAGGVGDMRALVLDDAAVQRAEIVTAPVERKIVPATVRLVGKVTYDESRVAHITTRVSGRLDKMYVDYTGVHVNKGDHLVYLYSQELYVMQAEYLITRKSGAGTGRDRLLLAGLTEPQVQELEKTGTPLLYETVYSPLSGTVIEKEGVEGMYVETGSRLYTIADLSNLWVMLDAYESDLPWIRYGQAATFTTEACPGTVFTGRVSFVSPTLDERTRTVSVRLNVDNAAGRLKPGFFVRAIVHASVAGEGKVIEAGLAGKWICPMHPEVVAASADKCPVCGMPLVTIESLGYAALAKDAAPPLVIPVTAPLITGTRSVVYVATPGAPGTYEGREIVLGPRAGDFYIVRSGLKEGEQVVVNGNVKIDSTLQIMARPSVMSGASGETNSVSVIGGGEGTHPSVSPKPQYGEQAPSREGMIKVPAAFTAQIERLFAAYTDLHEALADDDHDSAKGAAGDLRDVLKEVDMKLLDQDAHKAWMPMVATIEAAAAAIGGSADIKQARTQFKPMADTLITAAKKFGTGGAAAYVVHCPMANGGKGADWLQWDEDVRNPYFGSEMYECGSVTETIKK